MFKTERSDYKVIFVLTASQLSAGLQLVSAAYAEMFRPLCAELQLSQTAMDILLFLANNPEFQTARDICALRGLKPGLVSLTVEQLVQGGYLLRSTVPGDRRKWRLSCTEQAGPLIARGRELQEQFARRLTAGLTGEELETCRRCLRQCMANLKNPAEEDASHAAG